MNEHLTKVANDLGMAYDNYRNSVDRLNDLGGQVGQYSNQYEELTPKGEFAAQAAGSLGATALGGVLGGFAGKKIPTAGAPFGALAGTIAGGVLGAPAVAYGIRSLNDRKVPERVEVRKQLEQARDQLGNEDSRFENLQDELIHHGRQNPASLRSKLDPTDWADSLTDSHLSRQLRQDRRAESERQAIELERQRLENQHLGSQVGLNNSQGELNRAKAANKLHGLQQG